MFVNFLNAILSYLMVLIVIVVVAGVATTIGITMAKKKNGQKLAEDGADEK